MEERVEGTGRARTGKAGTGREDTRRDIHLNIYIYIHVSKMVIFINMVITRVKNGSSDMSLTAFDRKFHEKKDDIPPGACRPPYTSKYSIVGILVLT